MTPTSTKVTVKTSPTVTPYRIALGTWVEWSLGDMIHSRRGQLLQIGDTRYVTDVETGLCWSLTTNTIILRRVYSDAEISLT